MFAAARLASAVSGLSVTYWAASRLGREDSTLFVSWASAASGLVEALVALWAANSLNETGGRAAYKWLGMAAASVALWAALVPNQTSLLALRSFDGLVAGAISAWALEEVLGPARDAGAGRKLPSWFEGVFLFSFALGSIVAPLLWKQLGAYTLATSAVIYATLAMMRVGSLKTRNPVRRPFRLTSAVPIASLAMSASASMWVSQITLLLTGTKFPEQRFPGGFPPSSAGLIVVAYLIIAALGLGLWGNLMSRWAPVRVVAVASLGALAAPIALFLSNLDSVNNSLSSALTLAYIVCIVVQVGLVPGGMALAASFERGSLASLSSQFVAASSIGAIMGALLGGPVAAQWSFSGLCLASLAMAVVAVVAMAFESQLKANA